MKKVLFTATVDSHIKQFHTPYLKWFKEQGYEVHVATNGKEEIPYCDVKHVVSFERSPFKINNLKAIKQLKKIIDKEHFDIIHTHTPMGSVVTRLAAKNARKKGTRVIYTAHGFHFYKGAPIINWLLFYPVEKYLARYTDTLITINQEDYELAKKKFKKRCTDIQYIPGVGIDTERFRKVMTDEEKRELRKTMQLNDNDFIIIYIARLDKNKNQGFLIRTIKQCIKQNMNLHLLLVGVDELNGLYQKQTCTIRNNIHFLGYRSDIPRLLEISNVAVSVSLREGLPVNIMEAMSVGVPVIATDCRGNRDLVQNNINGYLIPKNNKDSFIRAVKKLMDGNIANRMSKEGKKISRQYSKDIIISKMEKIYEGE